MNNLFTYVSAINDSDAGEFVVERKRVEESEEHDGIITYYSEQIVKFKNGVIIKQCVEKDANFSHPEVVCEECFINYDVLFEPDNYDITPKQKNFINHCQEIFWLKISAVQSTQYRDGYLCIK
ncbi:hypothetical protein PCNPT3_08530 [Psychromonas sp. CNPT3]|uniref:hypothetical protein n=1 Tax=Psychromonas sp. CNPT3 TaxID=314282 RepID=UPI00006E76D0|nr:hypothetical protein [Psychromonas sp. CNPT3]AGH81644.1 hypothetical protein PCNPT3_08530 [Psychromonas sp. CNPT3]